MKKDFTHIPIELQTSVIEKFSTILISELKKIIPVPKESIDLFIIEAQESKLNDLSHVSHQLADIFLQQVANLIS